MGEGFRKAQRGPLPIYVSPVNPTPPLDAISEETQYETMHSLEGLNIPVKRSSYPLLNMKISRLTQTVEGGAKCHSVSPILEKHDESSVFKIWLSCQLKKTTINKQVIVAVLS